MTGLTPEERAAIRDAFQTPPAPDAVLARLRETPAPAPRRRPRFDAAAALLVAVLWGLVFLCIGLGEPGTEEVARRNRRLLALGKQVVHGLLMRGAEDDDPTK